MTEYRDKLYDTYAKEREKLDHASLEIGARYDRLVLTLSGGALVISLTFLEKFAPAPITWTLWLIISAWAFLLGSIILQLLSIGTSQDATRLQIVRLDAEYAQYFSDADPADKVRAHLTEPENPLVRHSTRLNTSARWLLIFGMLLLCAFSVCNMVLSKGSDMSENNNPPQKSTPPTVTSSQPRQDPPPVLTNRGSYTPPKNIIPPPPPPPSKNNGGGGKSGK